MIKIAHFGDVHIQNLKRHDEYREQFDKIYKELYNIKPDRIVIVGDLFEEFVAITNEAKNLSGEFLNTLTTISKVIIVPGNHDIMKKNKNRLNSIEVLINLLKNKNIIYLSKSGFYEDIDYDNIVWVNYSHLEKDIDPWSDKSYVKDDNKIYIALYHDQIYESLSDTGKKFDKNTNKSIKYFKKNDFVLLADIHKRQYFRDNKSAAYVGSTIQQHYGELPENHGFLLWNIENKNNFYVNEINIPNNNNFINFDLKREDINTDINYDNLLFKHELLNEKSSVKIHWTDLSSNINNFQNENKIKKYFNDYYNINNVIFDKNRIYTDISNVEMVTESIDILDESVHRKIFNEFLSINGYDDDFIDKILELDNIISNRLQKTFNNLGITWDIEKLWINNFKSYGDDIIIDFSQSEDNIIIQIGGENQNGKTTILDAISYVLYGKTTTTVKRLKNGDNRYINNKRDLDYCEGGVHLIINNEIYTIVRRTERKWNKNKTDIVSCSTNIDYYKGRIISDEYKITDEDRNKTQLFIESAIGDFSDFIRLVLTNADNINEILSMDRSVFIDSIIKDAGYDIFEKKLEEFKEYRKYISKDDIKINIGKEEKEKEEKENNRLLYLEDKNNINQELLDLEKCNEPLLKKRDSLLLNIHKIDESISNFNLSEINLLVDNEKNKITKREEQLLKINELKTEVLSYDDDLLKNKMIDYDNMRNYISENDKKISNIKNDIVKINSLINNINNNIENTKKQYIRNIEIIINNIEKDILFNKNKFNTIIIDYTNVLKDEFNKIVTEKNNYKKDIDTLILEQINIEKLINDLENSKYCITCERLLDDVDPNVINLKIQNNKKLLESSILKHKNIKTSYDSLSENMKLYEIKLDKLSKKEYDFDEKLNIQYDNYIKENNDCVNLININKKIIDDINNNKYPDELISLLELDNNNKINYLFDIDKNNNILKELSYENEIKNNELNNLKKQIEELESEKNKIQKKKDAILLEDKIKVDIEKSQLLINNYNNDIDKYNNQLYKIEENIKTNKELNNINNEINLLILSIKQKSELKSNLETKIGIIENEINTISNNINIYKEQLKRDEFLDVYAKCIHRDGLPTFLLKKSINLINKELDSLLIGQDYILYFDSELNLKLTSTLNLNSIQNAIESSGKERTFCSVVLKVALRKINTKSKPNFMMFDEMMGKLLNDSVNQFIELLNNIKLELSKLIIIEHIHYIDYDMLIEVERDQYGISNLKITI